MPSNGASEEAFDVRQEQHFGQDRDTVYRLNATEVVRRLDWLEYSVGALKRENELLRERVERLEDDRK